LKALVSEASGNTLAYGLTAFAKILQVADVQVEAFGVVDQWLIDRVWDLPTYFYFFCFILFLTKGCRLGHCTSSCEYFTTCDVDLGYFSIPSRSFESRRSSNSFIRSRRCKTTEFSTSFSWKT